MSIQIRSETDDDKTAVYDVNAAAFPTETEAKLVDALRKSASEYISQVAVEDQNVVGHIMFTPVTLEPFEDLRLMGLAPMAVSPSLQRGGIGSELVKTGLLRCTESDVGAVAVLGHPQYYPRFGFRPASQWGIKSEYEVPEEVFMMMELSPGYLQDYQGIIRYDAVFADI
ncbi:N-acetyltransferase GCN5 [uncultured Woeseiaceae bacterium]|uniref:N-acetyltransferase GCN5 n=1 Tax=uncultured Woeseiaceae bacterium TaxID=1983305 RepID=A0A7D9H5F7_9GAMM|nr:N-acetyltransferase GCN5 [uncultured Woeseiaceae bacterium]